MRSFLFTTVAFTGLYTVPAFAQDSPPAQSALAPSEADGSAQSGLEEIIVTAQRRMENSQRAALAIDVVTGDDLIKAGVTDATRLGEIAPALTVQPTSTGNFVFLRGVGNFTVAPVSDPAIAFNYDGVYIGRPSSTSGSFFDLQRVEVLKGPQGTLYGRNATGGAINVIPKKPDLGRLGGYVTGSYGSFHAVNVEGAINLPMGEDGALRISGSINKRDGYYDDGTGDEDSKSLRVQMMSQLTPGLMVRVAVDYADHDGLGTGVSYLGRSQYNTGTGKYDFIDSNLSLAEGVFTSDAQDFRQTAPAGPAGRVLNPLMPRPFRDNHFFGFNAEIEYNTGVGTLTVIPAYRNSDLDYLGASGFLFRTRETDEQYSLEARFAGESIGIFDYTVGGIFFNEQIDSQQRINFSTLTALLQDDLETTSYSAFGRLTANLTDRLRLVGGIRYTHDKKTFDEVGTNGTIACLNPAGCPDAPLFSLIDTFDELNFPFPNAGQPPVPAGGGAIAIRRPRAQSNELTNKRVTWRTSVEYDVAPRSLLYASVETGFRSGGFSGAAGFETYDPEYITAYTIGSKSRFFDNRFQLNIEGFYWKYRDQQVNFVGLDINGNPANQTQNIGRSVIKGVELDTQFLATPTTLLRANAQYLESDVKSFTYQASGAGSPPLTGCDVSPAGSGVVDIDCSGFPGYNSPKWTLNLGVQQTFELANFDLIVGADTQYKAKRYLAFEYLEQELVPSFWSSNAQITLAARDESWSITGYVRNIGNNRTPIYISNVALSNLLVTTATPPRTWGVRASYKF